MKRLLIKKLLRMNKLILLITLLIGLNSCHKSTINAIYISPEDKSYFVFNHNSFWIYTHNFDTTSDSVYYNGIFHYFDQAAPDLDSIERYIIFYNNIFIYNVELDPNNFSLEKKGITVHKPLKDYQKIDSLIINKQVFYDLEKFEFHNQNYSSCILYFAKNVGLVKYSLMRDNIDSTWEIKNYHIKLK